jgi:hypothetical protein
MTDDIGTGRPNRVEYLLGVPLSDDVERQWPQMGEVVRGRQLVSEIEATFTDFTLEVGRRHQLGDVIVVEWSCNYGDGHLYRNVTIGELRDGHAVRVTDYWGAPAETPASRRDRTARLNMPGDGIWKDAAHLGDH